MQEQPRTSGQVAAPAKKSREKAVSKRGRARPPSTNEDCAIVGWRPAPGAKNTGGAEAMAILWPIEKRPTGLFRSEEWLNTQSVADLLQMMHAYEKQQKETTTDNGTHRDTKPVPVNIKKGVDDCFEKLSHARFDLRMPLSGWSYWWPMMPLERTERYKSLDLKAVGAESQISKSAINR